MTAGWDALVVLAVLVVVALLALRYGADTRPGVDRPPDGWPANPSSCS
jgi:hypothetical protein